MSPERLLSSVATIAKDVIKVVTGGDRINIDEILKKKGYRRQASDFMSCEGEQYLKIKNKTKL